jgi:hypothetical protein
MLPYVSISLFLFDAFLLKALKRHFGRIKRLEHLHGYFMFKQQERSRVHLINYCIIQFLNDPLKLFQITSVSLYSNSFFFGSNNLNSSSLCR